MSIRLRLTLLYSAILAVTLIASGVALYNVVAQATFDAAGKELTAEANGLATALSPLGNVSPYDQRFQIPSDALLLIRNLDGTPTQQSNSLKALGVTLPLDPSVLAQLQAGATPPAPSVVSVGGQQLLLYNMAVGIQTQPYAILQYARPLQDFSHTLEPLRQVLLLGGVLVTLLAFLAGWVLSGLALRPINRITRTAQEIGTAQDFGRRVDYRGPHDEVGRLASTFNTMLGRLQAAFHAQHRFVADASHELRTPLTTIRGNLGLLQREPPIAEADRVAVLADLVSESERLSRLVGDLLTLARSDAGRSLRREPVPLRPLLADLIRRLAVTYPDRSVQQEAPSGLAVVGDPDALTQVLLILLDNALKFTPAGAAVTVETGEDEGQVCIAVRDHGPGIAPDALPHIFERFYQGDVMRTGTGSGLGLAIAKALVDGQHGSIAVQSQVGQGSVFTVTLPRATVAPGLELAPTSRS